MFSAAAGGAEGTQTELPASCLQFDCERTDDEERAQIRSGRKFRVTVQTVNDSFHRSGQRLAACDGERASDHVPTL